MPRLPFLLFATLTLSLTGCHVPDADDQTKVPTSPLDSIVIDQTQSAPDTQPIQPTTQAATQPATRPAPVTLNQQKEHRILELTPGLTLESVENQFDDSFISDSLFFQINCPDSSNAYYLLFNIDATEEHLVLWALFWMPKDAHIPAPIVIWPKSKAGLTFQEADLSPILAPTAQFPATQPTPRPN